MAKTARPIDVYYWPTPNGWKITIMLEELGAPYDVKLINISKGDQFRPEFLAISPNNRMPAIVDPDGPGGKPISVFESAAILMYLGRKFGRFYPSDERRRVEVEEWLAWQIANVGPVFGHGNHFRNYAPEKAPYAIRRFGDETHRLYGVLDKRLKGREFVAGEYSIADMALIGWIKGYARRDIDIDEFPDVKRWIDAMLARPAVDRGLKVGSDAPTTDLSKDQEAQRILFGQRAR
jgi:GSH-dependent disulfide-bond oxidoreductase